MATKTTKPAPARKRSKAVHSIMLSEEARAALEVLAKHNCRTRSGQIEYLIMQAHAQLQSGGAVPVRRGNVEFKPREIFDVNI